MSGIDYGKLKQRRSGARASFGWKPKEGENRVRVLPPNAAVLDDWGLLTDIAVSQKLHYFRVEGRPTEVSLCLEHNRERCPACDAWRAWRKSDDPGLKELARQVSPSDQYLLNIIDINNPQAGIQYWGANYTCWDKILEIVANPDWGNVLDPANGVDFVVNLTPGSKSRTGFNSYSVMPSPQRTSVMPILETDPDWRGKLDGLAEQINAAKERDELTGLLVEMGFPPPAGYKNPVPQPEYNAPPPAAPPAPAPVPTPAPAPPPQAAPQPVPVPTPTPAAPPAPETPPAPQATAPIGFHATGLHYDPGPDFPAKVPEAERPAGAPACYGDYNPQIHRCNPCPAQTDCQMKLLGIAG